MSKSSKLILAVTVGVALLLLLLFGRKNPTVQRVVQQAANALNIPEIAAVAPTDYDPTNYVLAGGSYAPVNPIGPGANSPGNGGGGCGCEPRKAQILPATLSSFASFMPPVTASQIQAVQKIVNPAPQSFPLRKGGSSLTMSGPVFQTPSVYYPSVAGVGGTNTLPSGYRLPSLSGR